MMPLPVLLLLFLPLRLLLLLLLPLLLPLFLLLLGQRGTRSVKRGGERLRFVYNEV